MGPAKSSLGLSSIFVVLENTMLATENVEVVVEKGLDEAIFCI